MYMIQIEESKLDKLSEYTEKMLKYGGKLMSCIEEMSEEGGMGQRGGQGGGGGYGNRYGERSGGGGGSMGGRYGERGGYGMKEEEDEWEEEMMMRERRGVRGSGRGRR